MLDTDGTKVNEANLDRVTWEQVRAAINGLASSEGEWAGYPLPVAGLRLRMEPRHPRRAGLDGATFGDTLSDGSRVDDEPGEGDLTVRNFWRTADGRTVWVYEGKERPGRAKVFVERDHSAAERLTLAVNTLGASAAWSVNAELRAVHKLRTLLSPHAFDQYLLTGSFLETSKRSGVTYLFRKLRPTIAQRSDPESQRVLFLAALCLHSIGYYERSWAGVLVPTDCVISHLLLMRGDERGYWAKANHHPLHAPEAGI